MKMQSKLNNTIINYFETNGRINRYIAAIIYLIRIVKDPIQVIVRRLKKTRNPLKQFKCLILIHQCYVKNTVANTDAIKLLSLINPRQQNQQYIQNYLSMQIIPQYKLYLQKCYQQKIEQVSQQKIGHTIGLDSMYTRYNLLKSGLQFVDVIYFFGRYYRSKYEYILDFNIVLARDIGQLYGQFKKMASNNQQLLDQQFRVDVQNIHENMYIVYYNCYYHSQVKKFMPELIITDEKPDILQLKYLQQKQLKSEQNKNKKHQSPKFCSHIKQTKQQKQAMHSTNHQTISTAMKIADSDDNTLLTQDNQKQYRNQQFNLQLQEQDTESSPQKLLKIFQTIVLQIQSKQHINYKSK